MPAHCNPAVNGGMAVILGGGRQKRHFSDHIYRAVGPQISCRIKGDHVNDFPKSLQIVIIGLFEAVSSFIT